MSVVIWICVILFVYYSRRAQWCFPPIKFKFLWTTNYFWFDAVLILWVDLRFIFIFLKCNIIIVVVVIVILFVVVVVVVVIFVVGSLFLSHFTFIAISFLCIIKKNAVSAHRINNGNKGMAKLNHNIALIRSSTHAKPYRHSISMTFDRLLYFSLFFDWWQNNCIL